VTARLVGEVNRTRRGRRESDARDPTRKFGSLRPDAGSPDYLTHFSVSSAMSLPDANGWLSRRCCGEANAGRFCRD
jgi:hypothetical protein